jgi:hypothetical protein
VARGGFLHVTPDLEGAARPGAEIVAEWMHGLASEREPETRARAARNLASARFVPGVRWMGTLLASQDVAGAAVAGLVRAAALGGTVPELLDPARFVATLDAALSKASVESAAARLVALSRAGCVAAGGAPLAPALLAGYDALDARARWGRLLVLERLGCADPDAVARARGTLGDVRAPAALRRQALSTVAALAPGRDPTASGVLDTIALFRAPMTRDKVTRLARGLATLGIEPPGRDLRSLPADLSAAARRALLVAWLWNGDPAVGTAHAAALLAADRSACTGESLLPELEPWLRRGESARVRTLLDSVRGSALAPCVDRLELLCGLVDGQEIQALLARAPTLVGDGDPVALGAVAAQRGDAVAARAARDKLLAVLTQALQEDRKPEACRDLLRGLELAAEGLFAERRDQEGNGLVEQVRRQLRSFPKAELVRTFERQPGTLAPGVEVLDLEADGFGPFEVPSTL